MSSNRGRQGIEFEVKSRELYAVRRALIMATTISKRATNPKTQHRHILYFRAFNAGDQVQINARQESGKEAFPRDLKQAGLDDLV